MRNPLLGALLRNKLIALVLVIEVALAYAIIVNAGSIVVERLTRLHVNTGVVSDGLLVAEIATTDGHPLSDAELRAALRIAHAVPSVVSVGTATGMPLAGGEWTSSMSVSPEPRAFSVSSAEYVVSPGTTRTMRLEILAGRDFHDSDYVPFSGTVPAAATVLLTKALATRLFPDGHALGQSVYVSGRQLRVIGIVLAMARPSVISTVDAQYSFVLPATANGVASRFILIRSASELHQTARAFREAINISTPGLFVSNVDTFSDIINRYLEHDRYVLGTMLITTLLALGAVAFGIYTLTSLWARHRQRSMAIRRTLGATRRDIVFHVIHEMILLSTVGCGIGVIVAYFVNRIGVLAYGMHTLSVAAVSFCFLIMLCLSILSTLRTAFRSAYTEPVEALRVH